MHGGDIATASLGYIDWYTQADLDGRTAVTSIAVNTATENGLICLNAAGNEGNDANPATSHLIAPADALRVLTIGAVNSAGAIAGFSSDGPTADGRRKPEVLALGVNNLVARVGNNTDFTRGSGTSFATPLAAGATACVLQAHPTWTVDQMRTALMLTASDHVAFGGPDAIFVRGHGIINAALAAVGDCDSDGQIDPLQVASDPAADCNGNGIPDECDIAAEHAVDTDSDQRPDECPPLCACDWNLADGLDSQDFFDFLNAFFDGDADFNGFDGTDSQDLFDFLNCFFEACP